MPITVLVAEDSAIMRRAIRSLLAQEPKVELIGEAGNVAQVIEMTNALRPQVVVLDLYMPAKVGMTPSDIKSALIAPLVVAISFANDNEA
jgi:chemotaxis response regulator CheB